MRPGRIVLVLLGLLTGLLGLSMLAGGIALTWAHSQRDDAGYYTSRVGAFATDGYAVTSGVFTIHSVEWVPDAFLGTVQVTVDSEDPLFLGIGSESAVDRYLSEVPSAEVTRVDYTPYRVTYAERSGDRTPAAPGDQDFWLASTTGAGQQELTWEPRSGTFVLVLMNADAGAGVAADVTVGVRTDVLSPVGIGLLVVGLVLCILGTAMVVGGAAGPGSGSGDAGHQVTARPYDPAAPTRPTDRPTYPMRFDGVPDAHLSRWLWLVKWLLALPHWLILSVLWVVFGVLTFVAGVAILFTGRYPRGIFDFNLGVLRWTWRVAFYALVLGTDKYPPFSLDPDPDYPAELEVDYPERLSRGLVLVKWWLLAMPHYIIVSVFGGGLTPWTWDWNGDQPGRLVLNVGLIGFLVLVAAVLLVFGRGYHRGIFDIVMGMERWTFRVVAYAALMRDEYPPFRFDTGCLDPAQPLPSAEPALVGPRYADRS